MQDQIIDQLPEGLIALEETCSHIGFTMPSDRYVGALLRTLVASKPAGKFLELGTGVGLSLVWLIDGMSPGSSITSVDNDPKLVSLVKPHFEQLPNVSIYL